MKIVKENIEFERRIEPSQAMGIGMTKEYYERRINELRGSVDEDIIEFIQDKASEMGGAFEMYLDEEQQEELYFLFQLLGKKNIKIRGFDIEDFERDSDYDNNQAFERGFNRKVQPWLDKGFEIWHEEENFNYNEYILVKYKVT